MPEQRSLGFIGSGNMAEAMVRGVLARGLVPADRIAASDVAPARRELFARMGVTALESNRAVVQRSDTVVLAVKPQTMAAVLGELRGAFEARHLVISIAAGITTAAIEAGAGKVPVIRVMPNTPMLVGCGAAALCRGRYAGAGDAAAARALLEAGGTAVEVDESAMDAVTALSGSGPAYVYFMAEHLLAAATAAGLDPAVAGPLFFQTVAGAAEMMKRAGQTPARLRAMVTSPGGTTEAAVGCFERHNMGAALAEGFRAAVARAEQLRKKDT